MANIVFVFYDFWGCKRGEEYVYPAFYHGLIEELKNNGNKVYCYIRPIVKVKFDFSSKIEDKLLNELKSINPDLFIIVNNQFWDISEHFDCPIICYSTDNIENYGNFDLLARKKDRFKFVVQQTSEKEDLINSIGVNKNNIEVIFPITPIKNTNTVKDKNITFVGSQWIWEGLVPLVEYMKNNPTTQDSKVAHVIHSALLNNVQGKSYEQIIEDLSKQYPKHLLQKILCVKNPNLYIGRMSGIRRARYLTNISDLGLEIYGNFWATPCMAYFPELALSYIGQPVVTKNEIEELYNRSKICFQLNHLHAKSGFSWKIVDIMASGSCLVTNKTQDLTALFGNNIPTYESEAEARELCIKILNNPAMAEDIVAYSNEQIERNFRPKYALEKLQNLTNVNLINNQSKNIVKIKMLDIPFDASKVSIKYTGIKKIKYKIWHHLNKQFGSAK